ncbi:MAG: C10 family peptidase [Muribaculaceae bacterium]|nr:C10 family peptidase [Muribaculaceae bacterium]
MKKFFVFMAALALMTQGADAKSITIDQAKAIAKQQFAQTAKFNASNAKMTLSYTAMNMKGVNDYYVFNREGGQGFVIVASDDLSTPVLGYSESGSFDMNTAPEVIKDMLKDYQNQMNWLRSHPQQAPKPRFTYDLQPYGVYPICGEVHWHQFPPYNNNVPRSSHALTSNGRCYVGCAPVAFATIMKGLRYPSKGFGQNSYSFMLDGQEVTVSAKFNDYTYNYSQMRNGYGENAYNAQAVSELMYEVGVAFNTKYSGESSDALVRDILKGMIAYFDYNTNIQFLQKANYSYNVQAWYDMIYTEIDAGRPVYMLGYRTIDNSGNSCHIGHAFVLDGYDKDGKVHVNWGFQPEEYNTYFDLSILSPRMYTSEGYAPYDVEKSGFNADQTMFIGICPDTTGLGGPVVQNVNLVADVMPANDLRATIDVQALSGPWSGSLRYGIVSKNSDNSYTTVYSTTADVEIEDEGIATLDLSGAYPYYLYEGRTYYIVVWSPYFAGSYEWNWFLNEPVPFTVGEWVTPPDPQVVVGDVDNDGYVTIGDVTALIDLMLREGDYTEAADMDGDGKVSIGDVTALIDFLLKDEVEE